MQIPEQYTRQSLGSGVIVDSKGYIITNNHVVDSATKIVVTSPMAKDVILLFKYRGNEVLGRRLAGLMESALGGEGERKRQLTSDGDECEG